MRIQLKRAYDAPLSSDGCRILVDRLWPRGVRKKEVRIDLWLKEAAPSAVLRKWFNHDPVKWNEFKKRYFAELDNQPSAITKLLRQTDRGAVTLIYGARDSEHNNAVALKEYLKDRFP